MFNFPQLVSISQITTTQLSRWTLNSLLHFFIQHGSNQIFCRIRSYCGQCHHCTCGRFTCTRVSFFIYGVIDTYFLSDRVELMPSTCKPVTLTPTWSPATTRTMRSWCKSLFFVVEMLLKNYFRARHGDHHNHHYHADSEEAQLRRRSFDDSDLEILV